MKEKLWLESGKEFLSVNQVANRLVIHIENYGSSAEYDLYSNDVRKLRDHLTLWLEEER